MADSSRLTSEDITGHSTVGSLVTRFQYNRENLLALIEAGKLKIEKLERDYTVRRAELRGRVMQLEELLRALEDTERGSNDG